MYTAFLSTVLDTSGDQPANMYPFLSNFPVNFGVDVPYSKSLNCTLNNSSSTPSVYVTVYFSSLSGTLFPFASLSHNAVYTAFLSTVLDTSGDQPANMYPFLSGFPPLNSGVFNPFNTSFF